MPSLRDAVLSLLLGSALALSCTMFGAFLTPLALARWNYQTQQHDELRALWAMIGIRHLPVFLFAIAAGKLIFACLKDPSAKLAAIAIAPYLIYLLATAIAESLGAGEPAFSWVGYEPWYFIWPHFVAAPAGLFCALSMVRRRRRSATPSPVGRVSKA